jgi:hypothetical protein
MITSAIHYPNSRITDLNTMKRALLLWDRYNLIGPFRGFDPGHTGVIAEAFSLIGGVLVPEAREQQIAHDGIVAFLETRDRLDPRFFLRRPGQAATSAGIPPEIYEVYPQKLLGETWWELERAGLTGDLLADADRPMTPWGGLVIMAKLADACAGDVFARVTNRADAYRAIANEIFRPDYRPSPATYDDQAGVVPVLLSMIDASNIPIQNLLRFRVEERDPTLRHRLLAHVSDHISEMRKAQSFNQVRMIQDQFEREMRLDLKHLRDALRLSRIKFAVSATVLTTVTGAFAIASSMTHGAMQVGTALAALSSSGLGVKQLADSFGAGLDLRQRQRDIMERHPMAYMHELSRRQ